MERMFFFNVCAFVCFGNFYCIEVLLLACFFLFWGISVCVKSEEENNEQDVCTILNKNKWIKIVSKKVNSNSALYWLVLKSWEFCCSFACFSFWQNQASSFTWVEVIEKNSSGCCKLLQEAMSVPAAHWQMGKGLKAIGAVLGKGILTNQKLVRLVHLDYSCTIVILIWSFCYLLPAKSYQEKKKEAETDGKTFINSCSSLGQME